MSPDLDEVEAYLQRDPTKFPKTQSNLFGEHTQSSWRTRDSVDRMSAVHELAQRYEVPVHLDGARVFNAAHALGVDVREVASHVDSVMFCLSKGLCAPVGSMLAGDADFIQEARRGRKRLGGAMRQSGVLAAAGIVALTEMPDRLGEDHANAKLLAKALSQFDELALNPEDVHSNMVFVIQSRWESPQRILQTAPCTITSRSHLRTDDCPNGRKS